MDGRFEKVRLGGLEAVKAACAYSYPKRAIVPETKINVIRRTSTQTFYLLRKWLSPDAISLPKQDICLISQKIEIYCTNTYHVTIHNLLKHCKLIRLKLEDIKCPFDSFQPEYQT